MPQNLIGERGQILGAVIHPGQPPRRTGGGRGIQPRKPHGDRLKGGEAVASLAHGTRLPNGGEYPAPAVHRNTRTPSVPHMRLGAWVMISPTWGSATARQRLSRLFSRITRSTRLRETRMPRQTRSRAQTLRCPSPSQGGLQVGLDGHQQKGEIEGFGPRRFAGGRSAVACCRDFMARQNPRPHRPAGGRRPNPCRERWRHSSPRPPPPQRAGRLRLASSSSTCMINSPIRPVPPHRIALAFLERGIDPGDRLLTPLLEPENLHAQLPRQKFHRLATQKPQGNLTLARHRLAKSQRACRRWPGENVDEPSSPSFKQLCSQNCRSCSGPPWTLRLSQFCVQGNRVRLTGS